MKTLKGIAANLAFILGSLLVLLPIGILSWLLEQAAERVQQLGKAISASLPKPRQVFSEAGYYWFWQLVAAGFFLWCLVSTLALMVVGQTGAMLWHLALAMTWAIIITRAWEQRHAN